MARQPNDRPARPLGKRLIASLLAVTLAAATGCTETTNFTNAIRWEVIMQHEVFIMQTAKTVDHLLCVLGAQGAGCDGLRFAACEQGRTMRAWQEMCFRNDWTDLRGAATVDAGAVL